MKGTILEYSIPTNEGHISGNDGCRYVFAGSEWKAAGVVPARGLAVDFNVEGGRATSVFLAVGATVGGGSGKKSKVVAALFAWFLGIFGAHKFYLGYTTPAVIMLLCGTVGWLLFCIPPIIVAIIAFIEFIIYLTKSDEEFDRIYVQGKKEWF